MFNKVAVIGAGTMGAGIAGQVANAGIDVVLLDMRSDGDHPNAIAQRGLDRLKDPDQPGLMDKSCTDRMTLGNIQDDLHLVSDCDWVAEAIVERLDIKHQLYANLAPLLSSEAILTSNTSTIPIKLLTEGMAEDLQRRFAITHFFNPVRFMRLLELVRGEKTEDTVMEKLAAFCEERLGKGVVPCADTPGFLANRVGCYAIQTALHEAFARDLAPQEADALFGRPMGIPKTGVFGLYDLIGIDLMSDVAKSLQTILPDEDAFHAVAEPISLMQEMVANGQTGNKLGKGFYQQPEGGAKQVLNFDTGEYEEFDRMMIPAALAAETEGVNTLLESGDSYADYAWDVLAKTLVYAAGLIPEVGNDPAAIDDAMKLGYNWVKGPFELIDELGVGHFVDRLSKEGREIPPILGVAAEEGSFYRVAHGELQRLLWDGADTQWQSIDRGASVLRFNEVRQTLTPENSNAVASWYKYQDAAVVEFHSKANALDGDSMAILADALAAVPKQGLSGLVVHNDAQHFSCGVNLEAVRGFYAKEDYDGLDSFLADFQKTVHAMSVADFPVVAVPVGLSIGGGFEVVLHAQHVVAHANSVMGLVESLVGVVPGGGGCKEMLYRWVELLECGSDDIAKASWKAFMNTGYGRTATSPMQAKKLAMMYSADRFEMNRDRQLTTVLDDLTQGKIRVNHRRRPALSMPGEPVYQAMASWLDEAHQKGELTSHDTVVGRQIAAVMTGGEVEPGTIWQEQDLFDAERRSFLSLAQHPDTQARIHHLLDLGITLRN